MRRRRMAPIVGLAVLAAGTALLGRHGYLAAKAAVAEVLIDCAFRASLEDGRPRRPWAWADMAPVAILEHPGLDVRRMVLTGATGGSLAFGVGHIDGTAAPNAPGRCVLAGHRSTVFAFLDDVRVGDVVRVTTFGGTRDWIVARMRVVPADGGDILGPGRGDSLTLVTCWPVDGVMPTPWRFAVELVPRPAPTAFENSATPTAYASAPSTTTARMLRWQTRALPRTR